MGQAVKRNYYVTGGISTHKGKNKANVVELSLKKILTHRFNSKYNFSKQNIGHSFKFIRDGPLLNCPKSNHPKHGKWDKMTQYSCMISA
jgi:hypothetical protein